MSRRVITLLALGLALAALLAAQAIAAQTGIELVGGTGRATLDLRGAVLGTLGRGRLSVMTLPGRDRPSVLVQGYTWTRVEGRSTVYGGQNIRFRIFRGSWRVRLAGSGINASAVGRGIVGLAGTGRYSLTGSDYRSWPARYQTIVLGS